MSHRGASFELYYQIKTISIGAQNCDLVFNYLLILNNFIKVFL